MESLSALNPSTLAALAAALAAGAAASLVWTGWRGGVWSPMPPAAVRALLRLAGVRPGELVVDLGAGDGRIVLLAAREFGARAVAVELDPLRARLIRWRAERAGLADRIQVVRGDLFRFPLQDADVVTAWLSQAALDRLAPWLRTQLEPGARVATYKKRFPGWPPTATDPRRAVYCWVIPAGGDAATDADTAPGADARAAGADARAAAG